MMQPEIDNNRAIARDTGLRQSIALAVCGIFSLGLYCTLPSIFARITSSQPSFAHEVFPWVKNVTEATLGPIRGRPDNFSVSAPYLGVCALLFAVYACVLWLLRGRQSAKTEAVVFWTGAVFLASFFFSPVMLSTDVFAYAFYGRLVSVYGADAYSIHAVYDHSDPFLLLYAHKFFGSVYGPLWTVLSAAITKLTGPHVGLTVFFFRLLAAGSVLSGAALILSVLRRKAPESAAQGMALFLWNPVVIMETAGGCHNDATLVALLLLGVWLHTRGLRAAAVVALTLSALLKLITGPLVLLYAWAVLRESENWRDRTRFLITSGIGAAVAVAMMFFLANVRSQSPVANFASAPDVYLNTFHELLFTGVRRTLGEDEESIATPMNFCGWWMEAGADTPFRSGPSETAPVQSVSPAGGRVLVIAPQYSTWMRAYDPLSHRKGYVLDDALDQVPTPPGPAPDADAGRLQTSPMRWPTVVLANRLVRNAMTLIFGIVGLLAAWRTTSFDRFLGWACVTMGAIYLTVATQIWPWYALWTLALGALKPGGGPAKFAVLFSAGMVTLYATLGFGSSKYDWIYDIRSLPAVVLPAVVWALWMLWRRKAAYGGTP